MVEIKKFLKKKSWHLKTRFVYYTENKICLFYIDNHKTDYIIFIFDNLQVDIEIFI